MSSGGESTMFAVAALLGIGNSLFHVWGGKQVVLQVGNDIRALGVFVSTGAFGLAVAMVFCSWTLLYIFLLAIIILATAYVMTDKSESHEHIQSKKLPTTSAHRSTLNPQRISFVIAIAAFVMFRSYLGKEFSLGAANTDAMILLVGFVTMLGKMAGGWISRWMGVVKALTMILIVVLVCMLTQRYSPVLPALAGLFMINCTMPITLYLANSVLPEREGLAFGILAAALMPGYLVK
jgi:predicted MFS family arabinose efflux permease